MEEVVAAEMSVGEAFLFLGSTVHAGGANTTLQSRPVHSFFYCRSWIRPEVRTFCIPIFRCWALVVCVFSICYLCTIS